MARGKYASVVNTGQYPRLPLEDAAYQDRINVRKSELVHELDTSSSGLARAYRALRAQKEEAEKKVKDVNFELTAVTQLLMDRYDEDGIASVRLEDGATVSLVAEPTGQVRDKEAFRRWCIANGLETSLQLWPSTMNSLVKQRTLDGEPAPDGVDIFIRVTPRFQKG